MAQKNQGSRNPVGWFEIYLDDIKRSQKFYEAVFNVWLDAMPDPSGQGLKMATFPMEMGQPNASGALVEMAGMKAGGNSTLVYFSSENCSLQESWVKAAGGKVFKPKTSIGEYGFMSLCTDTEGNMFGIHSQH